MQALPADAYLEYRYSTHATYASIFPVKLRANPLTIPDLVICLLGLQL
jgi:hypothetical protein